MAHDTHSGSLWGGRFADGPSDEMAALSQSTHFDWVLADYDLQGSIAHAHALERAGLLSAEDAAAILAELERLRGLVQSGGVVPDPDDEDVHGALERILIETDSPYLAPAPHRGKTNNPSYVPFVAKQIADIKGITVEAVAEATSHNFDQLFSAVSR